MATTPTGKARAVPLDARPPMDEWTTRLQLTEKSHEMIHQHDLTKKWEKKHIGVMSDDSDAFFF